MATVLGIDVGGTGVKGALVDTKSGSLISDKIKYATPRPSTPKKVVRVINQLIDDFGVRGERFGCGFPSVIKNNIVYTAANIDKGWMGVNLRNFFKEHTGSEVFFINDADAAGLAEMRFGAGKGVKGTVILLTLGTGIGSGIFLNGKLVPNTEFGHLLYKESVFEHYASNGARKRLDLSMKEWSKELNTFLNHVNFILNPDLIILGGGVSKKFEDFKGFLDVGTEVVPALMQNNAGIIGAAMKIE